MIIDRARLSVHNRFKAFFWRKIDKNERNDNLRIYHKTYRLKISKLK